MIEGSDYTSSSSYAQIPSTNVHADKLTSVGTNALSQVTSPDLQNAKKVSLATNWESIELSDAQLDAVQVSMPQLSKTLNEEKRIPQDRTLTVAALRPQALSNGKTLHPVEVAALQFYTRDGFKLLNGLFNFEPSIRQFMKNRDIPSDRFNEVCEAGKVLSKALGSALNKLPQSAENTLYRGDTIQEHKIGDYQKGAEITERKFSSVSDSSGKAQKFAADNAGNRGGIPTLFIIENPKNAKDIDSFSMITGEKERLYRPNQSWEITDVVEEKIYATTEINDEEDIQNAREKGELIEKVVIKNGKEKTKYYIEDRSEEPDRVLKVYMKEV